MTLAEAIECVQLLDKLSSEGADMYGAGFDLRQEFGYDRTTARRILALWIAAGEGPVESRAVAVLCGLGLASMEQTVTDLERLEMALRTVRGRATSEWSIIDLMDALIDEVTRRNLEISNRTGSIQTHEMQESRNADPETGRPEPRSAAEL